MTTTPSVLVNRLQAKARLRHLQLLVKLAELGSLRHTAEALGMSQPAATQQLAELERLVEVPLFERHARGVRITRAGAELLPIARSILTLLAEGADLLVSLKTEGESVVRVAAITSAIPGLLSSALPSFSARYPTTQVHVRECEPDGWGLLLARAEVDVVACRELPQPPAGFRFMPVLDDRLVVVCRPGHPLAGRKGVTWTRLAREQWLPAPVNSHARRVFDAQMAAIDATPRELRVVTRAPALTWAMLTASDALTLAPLGAMRQLVDAGALAIVEPRTPLPFARLGLLMPQQGASVAVQRLAEHLLAAAASGST